MERGTLSLEFPWQRHVVHGGADISHCVSVSVSVYIDLLFACCAIFLGNVCIHGDVDAAEGAFPPH